MFGTHTSLRWSVASKFVMLVVFAASTLVVVVPPRSAGATRQLQWNIAGWEQNGGSPGVDYALLLDIANYEASEGVPRTVTVQELCWSDNANEGTDQYDGLASYFYQRGYVWWAADNNDAQAPTRTLCHWQGVGVFAAANSFSTWAGAFAGNYVNHSSSDNSAPRKLVCVHPNLGFIGYSACVTHLTNVSTTVAQASLGEVRNRMVAYQLFGRPFVYFAGDLNLSTQYDRPAGSELYNWYYGPKSSYPMYEACSSSLKTHPNSSPTRKIDYSWYSGWTNGGSCVTSTAGGASDHRLLHSRIN